MGKTEELNEWARKQHAKSKASSVDKTEDLSKWASRQHAKSKASLSESMAATKSFVGRQTTRDDESETSSARSRQVAVDGREGFLAAKAEHANNYSVEEYAILALGICSLKEGSVKSVGTYSADEKEDIGVEFVTMAQKKLTKVTESDFCTIIPSDKSTWFVKSYEGWIYYIKTTKRYPKFLAIEVLDSLSNIILFGFKPEKKGTAEINEYCKTIYLEYGTLENGTKASEMLDQVDEIKDKMNSNINVMLENMENAEMLQSKADELLEQSKMFKKRTSKLKKEMWMKNKGAMILKAGTIGAVVIGATAGFLAGGPGGAAFVALPSVVAAEAIEVSLIAAACGVGYYATAKAAVKSWFWSLKFVQV